VRPTVRGRRGDGPDGRDGKILRETRYYGEPFEAPAWRAQWVQRIEEPVAS
jgi:hypothetical protein